MQKTRPQSLLNITLWRVIPATVLITTLLWLAIMLLVSHHQIEGLRHHLSERAAMKANMVGHTLNQLQLHAISIAEDKNIIETLTPSLKPHNIKESFNQRSLPGFPISHIYLEPVPDINLLPAGHTASGGEKTKNLITADHTGIEIRFPVISDRNTLLVICYASHLFPKLYGTTDPSDLLLVINSQEKVIYSSQRTFISPGSKIEPAKLHGWQQAESPMLIPGFKILVASDKVEGHSLPTLSSPKNLMGLAAALLFSCGIAYGSATLFSRRLRKISRQLAPPYLLSEQQEVAAENYPSELSEFEQQHQILMDQLQSTARYQQSLEHALQQAHQLKLLGQKAGGIMHEINTPSQYISDNLRFLAEAQPKLIALLQQLLTLNNAPNIPGTPDTNITRERIQELSVEIDLDYLLREIPVATEQSLSGINQIGQIATSIKSFVHPDDRQRKAAELDKLLDGAITICRSSWRYSAELTTHYGEQLPLLFCSPSRLQQVVINLIVNAAQAVEHYRGDRMKGLIHISTLYRDQTIQIRVTDNGGGISESIQHRIFSPFVTTKAVGEGTGLGLSISRAIIEQEHRGLLYFETEPGHGTTFIIELPLR